MNSQTIYATLKGYKKAIEKEGYQVYAIMLKGSQNYNLDDEFSDIDANAIIFPTINQLLQRKKLTKKFTFPTGEVVCHDLFSFSEIVTKGNPQFIEAVNSQYKIGKDLSIFQELKINPIALEKMAIEKAINFSKEYPSVKSKIDKYGYDPKQLHHIIRLYDLLQSNAKIYRYSEAKRVQMIAIKRGKIKYEKALKLKDEYINKISQEVANKKFLSQEVDQVKLEKLVKEELYKQAVYEKFGTYHTIINLRTFDQPMPKLIAKNIDKQALEAFKNHDLTIRCYLEIEKND